jgi:hypothetical protein
LPHTLQRLRLHAALFEDPGKLRLQFGAYELEHGQAAEHIDRRIALCLGAIQDGEMNRDQQSFQVGGAGLAQFGGASAARMNLLWPAAGTSISKSDSTSPKRQM